MSARAALHRLAADTTGTPMVEFAFAFPILLMLFLGSFVLSDAIACTRKVSVAAREVTDITSRYITLNTTDLATIEAATTQIMAPYSANNAMVRISQVQVCADHYHGTSGTVARVVWSHAQNGTPLTPDNTGGGTLPAGSPNAVPTSSLITLPPNMMGQGSPLQPSQGCSSGGYFIFGEVQYTYTPGVRAIGFGSGTPYTIYDFDYMSPRGSTSIGLS